MIWAGTGIHNDTGRVLDSLVGFIHPKNKQATDITINSTDMTDENS